MKHTIIIAQGNTEVSIEATDNQTIHQACREQGNHLVDSPCGGKGKCGKCLVYTVSGDFSPLAARERELLPESEIVHGARLACLCKALGSKVAIRVAHDNELSIYTGALAREVNVNPPVRSFGLVLEDSSLEHQTSDEARLASALAKLPCRAEAMRIPLSVLRALPALSRSGTALRATVTMDSLVWLRQARQGEGDFAVAIDIGSTTIVCHLIDLASGTKIGHASALNAQRSFGADIISRIAHVEEQSGGLEELRLCIAGQLSQLISKLAADHNVVPEDISCLGIAGNSTMLHLLMGTDPRALSRSPFTPVFLSCRIEDASVLRLVAHPGCAALILPGVSAYVGADIVAGMAAVDLGRKEGMSLFLDLGTNGEIVLGGKDSILCCATAAGPAFEGAGIEMGTGGITGAIDSVWVDNNSLKCSTIGNAAPIGICGSGLIDAIAALLATGLVDPTGRIPDEEEARALPAASRALIGTGKSGPLIWLDPEHTVYLSQADIRAAQLAKAAIAAGISTLLSLSGTEPDSIKHFYLAGGFGSLLDVHSAAEIGLFPASLAAKAIIAGNTSGAGATAACLSAQVVAECENLVARSQYIELSSRPDFNNAYIDNMMFPEPKNG